MNNTNFKLFPVWKIVGLLIIIPICWLIIWFLLSLLGHQLGIPMPSVGDSTAFLGSIGSIMGAIFTVGGLVVALVAVLTQIQLQDRVKQEVDKAREEVENTFNNKLRVEYEKRIQEQVEGMLAYFQAANTSDIQEAETLTREALKKYPQLPKIRSTLVLKMWSWTKNYFVGSLYQSAQFNPDNPLNHLSNRSIHVRPNIEVIEWLKDAIINNDDPDGQISAILALIYGYSEAYDKMLVTLTEVTKKYPTLIPFFQSPHHLLMLIYGCEKNYLRIEEVMRTVDLKLPKVEDVLSSVNNRKPDHTAQSVDWFVIERHSRKDESNIPIIIRIFLVFSLGAQTYSIVFKHKDNSFTIPPLNSLGTTETLEADKLVNQLFDKFIFICQDSQ